MKYIKFGNTGVNVSVIGFGSLRLPGYKEDDRAVDWKKGIRLIREAYELGINYFDTGYIYCHEQGESILGKAAKGIRNKLYISTKSPIWLFQKKSDYRKYLEEQLRKLNTDYIDFYHFHGLSEISYKQKVLKYDLIEEIIRSKKKGLIKHIGFSFHDTSDILRKIIDLGVFESIIVQYNIMDTTLEDGIAYAAYKGLGIAIMGPLGGGRIISLENSSQFKSKNVNLASLGLKFVLSNKNVSMVLSGIENTAQLKENIITACSSTFEFSEAEKEFINGIKKHKENLDLIPCTNCEYCMPCPKNVLIPRIFKLYNYYRLSGRADIAQREYNDDIKFAGYNIADSCKECGKCEKKCPQKISIIENLKKCHKILFCLNEK